MCPQWVGLFFSSASSPIEIRVVHFKWLGTSSMQSGFTPPPPPFLCLGLDLSTLFYCIFMDFSHWLIPYASFNFCLCQLSVLVIVLFYWLTSTSSKYVSSRTSETYSWFVNMHTHETVTTKYSEYRYGCHYTNIIACISSSNHHHSYGGGGGDFSFRILDILSFSINLLYMNSLIFWALLFIIALNIILDTVYGCVCMPLSMIIKAQILDFSTTVQQMISLSSWCFIHFCSRFSVMPSIHRDSYSSSYVLSYFIPYKHFIVEFQFHSGRICRLLQIVSMQF